MNNIITDRKDWKLHLSITTIGSPEGYKHLKFTGEQYNQEGELTNSSSYDFFLNEEEVSALSQIFWLEAS